MIATCKVLEEYPTGLLREVTFKDKPDVVQERVEFFPIGNVRILLASGFAIQPRNH